jgi:hypothetical protein
MSEIIFRRGFDYFVGYIAFRVLCQALVDKI